MRRYAPALAPLVLKALYYEARRRGIPMTRLANFCITEVLKGTEGWETARKEMDAPDRMQKRLRD